MNNIETFYKVHFNEKLGSGKFATVYRALRRFDELPCACKVIRRRDLDAQLVKNISAEIIALKTVNHPNIVKLYDMYEDRECFYLVLELVNGGELFDRITHKTFYAESDARCLCRTILRAIKHCHDLRLVHRCSFTVQPFSCLTLLQGSEARESDDGL
jgi:serine/threonine protein kinase